MQSTPNRTRIPNGLHHPHRANGLNGAHRALSMTRDRDAASLAAPSLAEADEEDPLKQRWAETAENISKLFGTGGNTRRSSKKPSPTSDAAAAGTAIHAKTSAPPKKPARQIDEDDYGDDDDDEESDSSKETPLKAKEKAALPNGLSPFAVRSPAPFSKAQVPRNVTSAPSEPAKSSEDVRKQLEEDKKAAADAAKKSFQCMFYTFENDRDAMLEQQKLDELDREVENEVSGGANNNQSGQQNGNAALGASATQGTLGSADLGASSLTLKHLIARIDMKRDMVRASDNQLRSLISEVRKGRSKWASEDRVGQEELYEASEKVLMELKAMTEYAQPFLQRVSKREAPDYYNVITKPMDIGTMLKKLKSLSYKSKKDFVDDLNLIWANCLKYNQDPAHPLRKKALHMRKETDKLTPLIPEITVRDRAEVEAEERRMQNLDADDSDEDDAPIMASRGRKAPAKGSKGTSGATKRAPTVAVNGDSNSSPAPEVKPAMHASASNLRNEFLRADSELHDASSQGFRTPPPPGTATPMVNGVHGSGAPGSQADVMEVDGFGNAMLGSAQEDVDEDDTEFKTWKQITKKDRAQAAAERHRLFRGDQLLKNLNTEEPALLRNKAIMRRWMRQQREVSEKPKDPAETHEGDGSGEQPAQGESLAEGIEKDEDSTLPDYYSSLATIPDLDERFQWKTDSEGYIVGHNEDWMRMYARESFKSPQSGLNTKLEVNMRQMQETRKICAKIGIVKQMQIQSQTYQNQFQKYEPQPFIEADCGPVVVSEPGPIMAPWLCRQTLQRSVGKVFYHAGFEDFQPAALDAVTDLAAEYFGKLASTFKTYQEQPKRAAPNGTSVPNHTSEEQVLHTLHEHGLDLEDLEFYIKDDVERLGTKLGVVHERMKAHLADLLRPALGDNAGQDGVGAFNDGSEQFVGGDFAEELGEDFFGFRELGLADELGLENMAVPLHLLQTRMHSNYQAQNQGPIATTGIIFDPPSPYEPITIHNVGALAGIAQDFFKEKLRRNHDEALIEDEELPQKQRFPKPRLPPTGKISSPRKRPLREQQQAAKKKRKMMEEAAATANGEKGGTVRGQPPIGKLKLEPPKSTAPAVGGEDPEKRDARASGEREDGAMISPESITAG